MSRTLLVQHWTFHTAKVGKAKREEFPPSQLGSVDLLDFVSEALSKAPAVDNAKRKLWTTIAGVRKAGSRALLVTGASGAYNEPGDVVGRLDGKVRYKMTADDAATSPTRSLFVVPDKGLGAFAFFERSTGRAISGMELANYLHREWLAASTGVTWNRDWVEQVDAWLKGAQLKAVSVRRYAGDSATTSPDVEEIGEYMFGAKAGRSKFLPHRSLEQILADPKVAYSLIGNRIEPEDGDRVFVDLVRGDQSKTYALDRGSLPKLQMQLDDGLGDGDFVRECATYASDVVFPKLGQAWRSEWVLPLAD